MSSVVIFFTCILLLSVAGTWAVRRAALRHGLMDVPNARSSHEVPTPRGGGAAIVVVSLLAVLALQLLGYVESGFCIAFCGGGAAVAFVGLLDDRYGVTPRWRLCIHLLAALWALYWLGVNISLRLGDHEIQLGMWSYLLGAISIVWAINLFNFMDGIDGLAASEAMYICGAAGLILWLQSAPATLILVSGVVAVASAGFLVWNWPPAKIFMGDAGSGYLGFCLAVLALASAREGSNWVFTWLILGGVFFVDATVTLLRRYRSGQRVSQAHRSHGYQLLSRRWAAHKPVTLAVLAVNVSWLLPLGYAAVVWPQISVWITLLALTPLVWLAIALGVGRSDA